jgi:hypothetical protein
MDQSDFRRRVETILQSVLADEENTYQSETVYVNEYVTINKVGLKHASRRSQNRKAPGLDGLLWN